MDQSPLGARLPGAEEREGKIARVGGKEPGRIPGETRSQTRNPAVQKRPPYPTRRPRQGIYGIHPKGELDYAKEELECSQNFSERKPSQVYDLREAHRPSGLRVICFIGRPKGRHYSTDVPLETLSPQSVGSICLLSFVSGAGLNRWS